MSCTYLPTTLAAASKGNSSLDTRAADFSDAHVIDSDVGICRFVAEVQRTLTCTVDQPRGVLTVDLLLVSVPSTPERRRDARG